ncbi:phosphatidylserine synthase, putative [Babesia ovata]|uniref:Phosphatidylserine synthase, putative n=1 Tax=Babesia ovata TaxID=189622 RepID=A0A2H6KET6_9APIC|nr:phosphatidylserine synthase, putative [Babesia ovata]GBE61496.1 phosphatidylserine synthase, putative [Babesia ovata]
MFDLPELKCHLFYLALIIVCVVRGPYPNFVATDIRPELAKRFRFEDIMVGNNFKGFFLPQQEPYFASFFVPQQLRFAQPTLLPHLLAIRICGEAIELGTLLPEQFFILLSGDYLDLLDFNLM